MQTSEASACARHVVRVCRAAGFEPRVSFESDDYLTVQGLVAAGVGVALIPQLALSQTVSYDIAVRELQPDGPVRHVVVSTPGAGGVAARRRGDAGDPARHGSPVPAVAGPGSGPEEGRQKKNAAPTFGGGGVRYWRLRRRAD